MSVSVTTDTTPSRLTQEAFWDFCRMNPEMPVEQDAEGRMIVLNRGGWNDGYLRSELGLQLANWNLNAGRPGYVSGSSTGYRLPNGALRSPDTSWNLRARIDALTPEQRRRFAPLCPDFVVELMSPSDSLPTIQAKMAEYRDNGARLGLLVDLAARTVHIYRPEQPVEILENPPSVECDPELPGFALDMTLIFSV